MPVVPPPMPFWPDLTHAIRSVIREELNDRLLNRREAAELIGVSVGTLDKMARNGAIGARVIGTVVRYRRSELLEAGRVKYGRR